MFWFSLQILYETFLILRIIQRDIIVNVHRSSYKVPLFMLDFNKTWIFLTDFRKIRKYKLLRKIHPIGFELFHAVGRTDKHNDMTKLRVAFRNFANAPKSVNGKVVTILRKLREHLGTCLNPLKRALTYASLSVKLHFANTIVFYISYDSLNKCSEFYFSNDH